MDYNILKEENDTKKYQQINLGKMIEFHNEDKQSLEKILEKIEEYK